MAWQQAGNQAGNEAGNRPGNDWAPPMKATTWWSRENPSLTSPHRRGIHDYALPNPLAPPFPGAHLDETQDRLSHSLDAL